MISNGPSFEIHLRWFLFVRSDTRKWECLAGELGVLNSAVSGSGAVIASQVVKT